MISRKTEALQDLPHILDLLPSISFEEDTLETILPHIPFDTQVSLPLVSFGADDEQTELPHVSFEAGASLPHVSFAPDTPQTTLPFIPFKDSEV